MIRILSILLLSTSAIIAATEAPSNIQHIRNTIGIFEKPRGEKNMHVTGPSTNDFSWGKITRGSPGRNSLKFRGEGFKTPLNKWFKIGSISYYNGTTATDTNASMVNLRITLTYDDGSESSFSMPIKFISTPNTGSHKDNADIIKIDDNQKGKVMKIDNNLYTVNLKFGTAPTEFGFRDEESEFGVFEGFSATIDLNAIFIPYTPPPPSAEVVDPVKAIPVKQGYEFSSRKKFTAAKKPAPNQISSTKASATAKPPTSGAPDIISLPPSKLPATGIPPLPTAKKSGPKLNIARSPAAEENNEPAAPKRIALPPSKISSSNQQKGKGKLAHSTPERQTIKPPPPARFNQGPSTFRTSADTRGQATYLDPLAYSVFRSVGIRVNTERGRTYLIQTTPDGVNWNNFSDPIIGDGTEKIIFEEIGGSVIREYRIKVTQTQ